MTDRPHVALFEEIYIGNVRGIVSRVRAPGDPCGDLEVVLNPDKPSSHDVIWSGDGWLFTEHGDFAGQAARLESLAPFVAALRQIRQAS